jgi:hypothetical protein
MIDYATRLSILISARKGQASSEASLIKSYSIFELRNL